MVTVAPGSAAPVSSVTLPRSEPYSACAPRSPPPTPTPPRADLSTKSSYFLQKNRPVIIDGAILPGGCRKIVTNCDKRHRSLDTGTREWHTRASDSDETPSHSVGPCPCARLLLATSCGRVQSAGTEQPVTIRLSTGFPTGNFRPFSEALVKGYAQLMPDVRIERRHAAGRCATSRRWRTARSTSGSRRQASPTWPTTADCASRGGRCEAFAASPY